MDAAKKKQGAEMTINSCWHDCTHDYSKKEALNIKEL